jgi:hypothetical protein
MNSREKILALSLGGMLGTVLAWLIVSKAIITPYRTAGHDILEEEITLDEKTKYLGLHPIFAKQFANFRGRTYGEDYDVAFDRFDSAVKGWLDDAGLGDSSEVSFVAEPLVGRSKIRDVSLRIKASGFLADVVGFLHRLHADPHLLKIASIRLTPTAKDARKVVASIHAVTKFLPPPELEDADRNPTPIEEQEIPSRLAFAESDYVAIANQSPFVPTWAPPTPKPQPTPRPDAVTPLPTPKPIPTPTPNPERLASVLIIENRMKAHLYNPESGSTRIVERNEKITAGETFFLAEPPFGIIIRDPGKTLYYVPLGGVISDRMPIADNSEIPLKLLERLEVRGLVPRKKADKS